jgi:hypothetical protein
LAHLLMHRTFIVMSPRWKGWPVRAFAVMRPLLSRTAHLKTSSNAKYKLPRGCRLEGTAGP